MVGRTGLPYLILIVSLAITGIITYYVWLGDINRDRFRLESASQRATARIDERLTAHLALLRATRALFAASEAVTRSEFHSYVEQLELHAQYPGIQGIGFILRATPETVPYIELSAQQAGISSYRVWPATRQPEQYPIFYLEPRDVRNVESLGFDMFSEDVRRAAMEVARDTGHAVTTPKLQLIQSTDGDRQSSFLIFLPVYRSGTIPDTVEARRTDLLGFVYSPVRAQDMLTGVFGDGHDSIVSLQLYDDRVSADRLLGSFGKPKRWASFRSEHTFEPPGQTWKLVYRPSTSFDVGFRSGQGVLILIVGTIVSALFFVLSRREGIAHRAMQEEFVERVQAEQAAKESEERFRTMADHAPVMLWLVDLQGKATWFNKPWLHFTGRKMEEILGSQVLKDIYADDLAESIDRFFEAFHARRWFSYECRLRHWDGTYRWVLTRGIPRFSESGEFMGYIGTCIDIEEMKRSEQKILELNETLENRVEERTEMLMKSLSELESFSYAVAHDLRAPLRAMGGYARILQEDFAQGLDETARSYLIRIIENSNRMSRLIDGLLDLARISRAELHYGPVDLSAVGEEIAAQLRKRDLKREVSFDIQPGMHAQGDERLLTLVVQNLLENAWKFTQASPHPRVVFGVRDGVYCVQDNGVGYDPAHSDKLFKEFQRLHQSHEYPGSGIGLATTKRIVERHGGRIWAESEPGQGATFFFTLADRPPAFGLTAPLAKRAPQEAPPKNKIGPSL